MGLENLPKPPKTLQTPPPIQFFSSPKLGGFCIKKTKPPKALPSHSSPFFPFIPSFFYKPPPQNSKAEPKRKFTARKFGPGLKILSYMLCGDHEFFFHGILEIACRYLLAALVGLLFCIHATNLWT